MITILKRAAYGSVALCGITVGGCMPPPRPEPLIPSKLYAEQIWREQREQGPAQERARVRSGSFQSSNAAAGVVPQVRFASDELPPERVALSAAGDTVTNVGSSAQSEPQFYKQESSLKDKREYQRGLPLGDPGVTASLWRESRGNSDLFHDHRAWQPMDLITIVVTENSEGKNEANTEIKQKSTVLASIENFLGFEVDALESNTPPGSTESNLDLENLIRAGTQNDFKGEGKTNRKDSLTAKISAMVAEVLPSGVMRIEGQKIISVNSEEKVMVISGLIRPKDVNSVNEISSAKIANMRIDYYGNGIVGEAQQGGWLSRLMRTVWPF